MNYTEAVDKAKQGDNDAFTFLYEQTYQKAYYVALKYLKNETIAQDVLQEAYVAAFKSLQQLDDPEKFPAWLSRIVATRSLNELKKKNPMLFSETENEEGQDISETFEDDRVDTQPELSIDQKETQRLIREIIEALSEEQRVCITMFYLDEMPVKEIAEILQVSENTVKSRLNYGRQKIKDKVLDLEKKGTKLYGLSPIPFFLLLCREEASAAEIAVPAFSAVACAEAASAGKTILGGTLVAGANGLTTKIVAGVIAGTLLVGGGAALYSSMNDTSSETVEIQNSVEKADEKDLLQEYREQLKGNEDVIQTEMESETESEIESEIEEVSIWKGTSSADGLFQPNQFYQYEDAVYFIYQGQPYILNYNLTSSTLSRVLVSGGIIDAGGRIMFLNIFDNKYYFTFKSYHSEEGYDVRKIVRCDMDGQHFEDLGQGTSCIVADNKIYYRHSEPSTIGEKGEIISHCWEEDGQYMVMDLDGSNTHVLETAYPISQGYLYDNKFVYISEETPGIFWDLEGTQYSFDEVGYCDNYIGQGTDSASGQTYTLQLEEVTELSMYGYGAQSFRAISRINCDTGEKEKVINCMYGLGHPIIFGDYILVDDATDEIATWCRAIYLYRLDGTLEATVFTWTDGG